MSFSQKFRISEYRITQVGSWIISLRPTQVTLGSLVLSLQRDCSNIADLTETESQDLGQSFKVIQRLFEKTFNPQKINYLLLMMVDNQVHFHVIPRYEQPVIFMNKVYPDKYFPKPVDITNSLELNESDFLEILSHYKRTIK